MIMDSTLSSGESNGSRFFLTKVVLKDAPSKSMVASGVHYSTAKCKMELHDRINRKQELFIAREFDNIT